jgi:hypothetical protein
MPKRKAIEYGVIPGYLSGKTHLSIYKPGDFIDNEDYLVMIGGCGVGHAKTPKEAEDLLLSRAIEMCANQIEAAIAKAMHYTEQKKKLLGNGIKRTE